MSSPLSIGGTAASPAPTPARLAAVQGRPFAARASQRAAAPQVAPHAARTDAVAERPSPAS